MCAFDTIALVSLCVSTTASNSISYNATNFVCTFDTIALVGLYVCEYHCFKFDL